MTKVDVFEKVSESMGLKKKESAELVEAVLH